MRWSLVVAMAFSAGFLPSHAEPANLEHIVTDLGSRGGVNDEASHRSRKTAAKRSVTTNVPRANPLRSVRLLIVEWARRGPRSGQATLQAAARRAR
jgi:hypothetical protein